MKPEGSLPQLQMPSTCPYPEPNQSSSFPHQNYFQKIQLNIILHLRLGLPSGLFPSGFTTRTLYTPLLSPIRATAPAHLILLDFITRTKMGEGYRSLSSSLCGFLHFPCFLIPLRLKYSSQHPILKHPQPTFLPQCERPSFTLI